MGFIGFIICILFALLFGAILDRTIIISKDLEEIKEDGYYALAFKEKTYALEIMNYVKDVFDDNGFVRVYDLYFLSRVRVEHMKNCYYKYGWTDISDFRLIEDEELGYIIDCPFPERLEK